LFRSYCQNGVIFGWKSDEQFRIVHRFKSREQVALLANEAIAAALKLSEEGAVKFIEAQHQYVNPTRLDGILGRWAGRYGLTIAQKDSWLERVENISNRNGRVSKADLVNEITYLSHNTESIEVTQDFERLAGDLVFAELPRGAVNNSGDFLVTD
jgi:hypothetical protein